MASTFNGEIEKPKDTKAFLIGMKKFFKLHAYVENMNAMVLIFGLNGREYIRCE